MTLANERRNTASPLRTVTFLSVVIVAFLVVGFRLHAVQIRQGADFAKRSRDNFVQTKRLAHDRGEILDREGRVLVGNRSSYDVTVTPAFLPDTRRVLARLGQVVGLSKDDIEDFGVAFSSAVKERGPPILLARHLDESTVVKFRALQMDLDLPIEAAPVIASEEGYAIYIDPEEFPSATRVFRRVGAAMGHTPKEHARMVARANAATGLARYKDVMIQHDVPVAIAERLMMRIDLGDLPGISVREGRGRDYRYDRLAAHVLGYVNELSPEELLKRRDLGYRLGDRIGRRGVEHSFEEQLRGVDGYEPVVVDSKGRVQRSELADGLREEFGDHLRPKAGNRVVLTFDRDIQRVAEESFPGRAGAVVVMEVKTGRLLALTSTPAFNPNLVSGVFDRSERRRLHALRTLRPWRFRAIQDHYAPGSTFKVVTALAALRAHATTYHEKIRCNGAFRLGDTRFRCWKGPGHGLVDMVDSLAKSCDVYYYTLGNRVGLDAIAGAGADMGFGSRTGIPIIGEAPGIMPTKAWYNKRSKDGYTRGAAVNASIGQGAVTVTPLQLAVAYASLANGGTVYRPQVALRIEASDGRAVQRFEPEVLRRFELSAEDRAVLMHGLTNVVNDRSGTAYYRRLKTLAVAGKTGTAQVAKLGATRLKASLMAYEVRDHAWFAALAPADNPEIAVVVLNEHGGHGGSGAAPTAMAVIDAWHKKQQARSAQSALAATKVACGGAWCPPAED